MDSRPPHRVGIYLALMQLLFALTWTIYIIYLPQLAAQAGIPKRAVVYILLLDQLIFVLMDYSLGVAADRVARVLGRLGYFVLGISVASCAAFLLLPFAAPQGAAWLFLLLTILWTATSSALRAPPFMLIGKYVPQPSVPWISALSLFGLGVAGALGPYLTLTLRDVDPRLPFAIASIALALTTWGIVWAERALANMPRTAAVTAPAASSKPTPWMMAFLFAVLLLGLGFQVHFSLNSAPLYLRHAKPEQLPYLIPVFWIGFNILMLPASLATRRYGGVAVAGAGAAIAAIASLIGTYAGNLDTLIAMQFIAGGGWGCVLMSAFAAALALGHTGREGKMTGGLFSLLALAAFARIAVIAAELNKDPAFVNLMSWIPIAAWGIAAVLLLLLLPRVGKPPAAAAA